MNYNVYVSQVNVIIKFVLYHKVPVLIDKTRKNVKWRKDIWYTIYVIYAKNRQIDRVDIMT